MYSNKGIIFDSSSPLNIRSKGKVMYGIYCSHKTHFETINALEYNPMPTIDLLLLKLLKTQKLNSSTNRVIS
ncbi:hypothetical protein DERP_008139 [Dermatophagoides pteronyssinus]|uniref:Uncharacterized protein n=1 Tax=Dermatophagoides pteronyssinus TaxID=6956 RepID=A0ABQ8JKN1_DERPT|nr:hypothetical protein DERP_008139 [Dermatophagoides pteronyssinus]